MRTTVWKDSLKSETALQWVTAMVRLRLSDNRERSFRIRPAPNLEAGAGMMSQES